MKQINRFGFPQWAMGLVLASAAAIGLHAMTQQPAAMVKESGASRMLMEGAVIRIKSASTGKYLRLENVEGTQILRATGDNPSDPAAAFVVAKQSGRLTLQPQMLTSTPNMLVQTNPIYWETKKDVGALSDAGGLVTIKTFDSVANIDAAPWWIVHGKSLANCYFQSAFTKGFMIAVAKAKWTRDLDQAVWTRNKKNKPAKAAWKKPLIKGLKIKGPKIKREKRARFTVEIISAPYAAPPAGAMPVPGAPMAGAAAGGSMMVGAVPPMPAVDKFPTSAPIPEGGGVGVSSVQQTIEPMPQFSAGQERKLAGDLKFKGAFYGDFATNRLIDVTKRIDKIEDNNKLYMNPKPGNWMNAQLKGDPAPGSSKELRIWFQFGNNPVQMLRVGENNPVKLDRQTAAGEGQVSPVAPSFMPAPAETPSILVKAIEAVPAIVGAAVGALVDDVEEPTQEETFKVTPDRPVANEALLAGLPAGTIIEMRNKATGKRYRPGFSGDRKNINLVQSVRDEDNIHERFIVMRDGSEIGLRTSWSAQFPTHLALTSRMSDNKPIIRFTESVFHKKDAKASRWILAGDSLNNCTLVDRANNIQIGPVSIDVIARPATPAGFESLKQYAARVAVNDRGDIVTLGAHGGLRKFDGTTWSNLPKPAPVKRDWSCRDVALAGDGTIWAIFGSMIDHEKKGFPVYKYTGGAWVRVDGVSLLRIAAGGQRVAGVTQINGRDKVFMLEGDTWKTIERPNDQKGHLVSVAMAKFGRLWVIDASGATWERSNGEWEKEENQRSMHIAAGDFDTVYGVGFGFNLRHWRGEGKAVWDDLGGNIRYVAASPNNVVAIIAGPEKEKGGEIFIKRAPGAPKVGKGMVTAEEPAAAAPSVSAAGAPAVPFGERVNALFGVLGAKSTAADADSYLTKISDLVDMRLLASPEELQALKDLIASLAYVPIIKSDNGRLTKVSDLGKRAATEYTNDELLAKLGDLARKSPMSADDSLMMGRIASLLQARGVAVPAAAAAVPVPQPLPPAALPVVLYSDSVRALFSAISPIETDAAKKDAFLAQLEAAVVGRVIASADDLQTLKNVIGAVLVYPAFTSDSARMEKLNNYKKQVDTPVTNADRLAYLTALSAKPVLTDADRAAMAQISSALGQAPPPAAAAPAAPSVSPSTATTTPTSARQLPTRRYPMTTTRMAPGYGQYQPAGAIQRTAVPQQATVPAAGRPSMPGMVRGQVAPTRADLLARTRASRTLFGGEQPAPAVPTTAPGTTATPPPVPAPEQLPPQPTGTTTTVLPQGSMVSR